MAKVIPIVGVAGRVTPAGPVELRFNRLDGKADLTIAFMPSYLDKLAEVLQRLHEAPEVLISTEKLPAGATEVVRGTTPLQPIQSGYRVYAAPRDRLVSLAIYYEPETAAVLALTRDETLRLIDRLQKGLSALGDA